MMFFPRYSKYPIQKKRLRRWPQVPLRSRLAGAVGFSESGLKHCGEYLEDLRQRGATAYAGRAVECPLEVVVLEVHGLGWNV